MENRDIILDLLKKSIVALSSDAWKNLAKSLGEETERGRHEAEQRQRILYKEIVKVENGKYSTMFHNFRLGSAIYLGWIIKTNAHRSKSPHP